MSATHSLCQRSTLLYTVAVLQRLVQSNNLCDVSHMNCLYSFDRLLDSSKMYYCVLWLWGLLHMTGNHGNRIRLL